MLVFYFVCAAVSNGNEEICKLLIGENPISKETLIGESNAYGNTPLHTAVRAGNVEIVRLLLENGFDINAKNHVRSTVLHLCAFLAFTADMEENKVNNSTSEDTRNNNSLLVQPHLQIAAMLLSNENFKMINEQDQNGFTPLHVAAQRGCDEMVTLLIDSGADLSIRTSIDSKGRGGRTAFGMAKFAGKGKTCELISKLEKAKEAKNCLVGGLASDLKSGYSISNPIVGAGGIGVRRKSKP